MCKFKNSLLSRLRLSLVLMMISSILFLTGCLQPQTFKGSGTVSPYQEGKEHVVSADNLYEVSYLNKDYYVLRQTAAPCAVIDSLKFGTSYVVLNKTYLRLESVGNFVQTGVASWYGPNFNGKTTANGETYNMYGPTAAHKSLPFNTNIYVYNLLNTKSTTVRINDRGPFHDGRVIDLSKSAADEVGLLAGGTAPVYISSEGTASSLVRSYNKIIEQVEKENPGFCTSYFEYSSDRESELGIVGSSYDINAKAAATSTPVVAASSNAGDTIVDLSSGASPISATRFNPQSEDDLVVDTTTAPYEYNLSSNEVYPSVVDVKTAPEDYENPLGSGAPVEVAAVPTPAPVAEDVKPLVVSNNLVFKVIPLSDGSYRTEKYTIRNDYLIQVGAFINMTYAINLASKLDYSIIAATEIRGRLFYKVLIDKFNNEFEARGSLNYYRQDYYDAFIAVYRR